MKIENALNWILDFVEAESIPYMVMGGLAALAHGSRRELYDIDLYVSNSRMPEIAEFGKEYLTFGPSRYKDEFWDIEGVQFIIAGIKVEIATDSDYRFFSQVENRWVEQPIDFNSTVKQFAFGREMDTMSLEQLITYKKLLARDVDLDDVQRLLKVS